MKIQFIKSIGSIPYDERYPVAKEEHRGKIARVQGSQGRTLMMILPCGHHATIDTWNITDIDTDHPSATPSIFCRYSNDGTLGNCWHGYLTNGELRSV